jgi:hypothetical protein
MLRYLTIVPLLGALTLLTAADATAQLRRAPPPAQREVPLEGTYENVSSGGTAYVYKRGRGYLFVNEKGTEARFEYTGRGRLEMTSGDWDPTTVTVGKDRRGQTRLRFDSGGKPGYWVRAD